METGKSSILESDFLKNLDDVRDSNLLKYSEDFTQSVWNVSAGVKRLSATSIQNPFSTTSRVSSLSGSPSIFQDLYLNAANSVGQYTFSVFAHTSSKANLLHLSLNITGAFDSSRGAKFDPRTGKILEDQSSGKIPLDDIHVQNIGNGWNRYFVTISQTSAVDTNIRAQIFYNSTTTDAAPWTNNIILWGAQLQKGNPSYKYFKTLSTPKASLIEEGFLNLDSVEPSLGLPYTTNILTSSQDYLGWNSTNLTLTRNVPAFYSPISTFDVFRLTPTTTNGIHHINRTISLPQTGIPYTFSTYFREDKNNSIAYRYAAIMGTAVGSSPSSYFRAIVNLDNGSLAAYDGRNISLSAISITPSFSGWYRFSITSQYENYKNILFQIFSGQQASLNLTFAGDGSRHIYAWGSQLEKGIYTSDYIKTEKEAKSGITYTDKLYSNTDPTSSYHFLTVAAPEDNSYKNSRRFLGNNNLHINKNKLSFHHPNPTYSFEVSGTLHALSAFFDTLSTNYFTGSTLSFVDFLSVNFDSDVFSENKWYIDYLSADKVFVTSLCSLSTVIIDISVPSICAKDVFSSINWNVTAGGHLSAYNIFLRDKLISPYISSTNSRVFQLTAENFTIYNNLTSLSSLSAGKINGFIQIDPSSALYYEGNVLTTRLSSVYFFGVKPTDSFSTDNISITRTLTGSWDSTNTIETYPVLKPYFKNIKQVFDYISNRNVYGDELNILIYDDIVQDNNNNDGSFSSAGGSYSGNIEARYYPFTSLPANFIANGFKSGDYVWRVNDPDDTQKTINGKINYWGVDRLNFKNLNIHGMYEIGSSINVNGKKQYTIEKPFSVPPRKIAFRTYICNNPSLPVGGFGTNVNDWRSLSTLSASDVILRQIYFNGDEMDVNIYNLCFEFETNSNDSTCLYFKSGNSYLNNVTVAALNSGYYKYGAILAWPKSTVYVCGKTQIDPYLLTPARWNLWQNLPTAENQSYYPGYGLAIVGNPTSQTLPTLFDNGFIQAWKSKIYFMDFQVNRRIGRYSFLNASIILDGRFSANSFYYLRQQSKIYNNNHVFKTTTFSLSNLNANIYNYAPNGSNQYINQFQSTNRDNFYYVYFEDSTSTLTPHYFEINNWEFRDSVELVNSPVNFNTNFTAKLVNNDKSFYLFNTTTKTVNLSGLVYDLYKKNSLQAAPPLNDNLYLYNYIDPSELPLFSTSGLYQLSSPVSPGVFFTLNYYSPDFGLS